MTDDFIPIDLNKVTTYSLADRKSKVEKELLARTWEKGGRFQDFMDRLPKILAGEHIRSVIQSIVEAKHKDKTVLFGMGAHVIKVGLGPIIIDLMERGVITAISMNGAGMIHDLELAVMGRTSEDVADSLGEGNFGMARETGMLLNRAAVWAAKNDQGLGKAAGLKIMEEKPRFIECSILAAAVRLHIPVTVHVAVGTDIIHMHPSFDPEATGRATHRDFRLFASVVSSLEEGVFLNVGSAVILPEVFLKALTLARNLGGQVNRFTAINLDFIQHYRPMTNVVKRPTAQGGRGISLVGHHELMLPLIAAGVIEAL